MPISAFRYAGQVLAQAAGIFDPQKQNTGMLELVIDKLVPGGKEILTLSLEKFEVPGREVEVGDLHYLNGSVHYPKKPTPQANISVTYRDFPLAKSRSVLQRWFEKVYHEETGLMLVPSILKATGFVVLFNETGLFARTGLLMGAWITKMPTVTVDFSVGDHMTMETEIACDRLIWLPDLHSPSP
jgi:hypothetical protein